MKKYHKKAQSSIEFAVLITFMMLFLAVFLVFIQSKTAEAQEAKNREYVTNIKNLVFNEITIAEAMPPNYTKNFTLPSYLDGSNYTININEGIEFVINFRNKEYTYFFIQDFNETSNIQKGLNQIQKLKKNNIDYKIIALS